MAELDYAYLAEYAQAKGGVLTAVGASFTEVETTQLPLMMDLYVAGRIRMQEDETPPRLEVEISAPGEEVSVSAGFTVEDSPAVVRYSDKKAAVFVVHGPVVVSQSGLVEVQIVLNDEPVRRLAYSVSEHVPRD